MANLIDKLFSKYDFDAIEAAIAKAEQSTLGEIAVEIRQRCYEWHRERVIYSLIVTVIVAVVSLFLTKQENWGVYYDFLQSSLYGTAAYLLTYFLLYKLLKGMKRRQKKVWDAAVESFGNLTPVRNLAGALIFISLEENETAIVVDSGIGDKVAPEIWLQIRLDTIAALNNGKHVEGIVAAIERISAMMAEHFPGDGSEPNQLPNKPIIS